MSSHSKASQFHPVRHDRLIQEHEHDTYKLRGKLPEPTVCPQCGAVFHKGRWEWAARPADAHEETCPACHRIHDEFPAGYVHLAGGFFSAHADEVTQLVRNEAEREGQDHPLERVMAIKPEDGGQLVTTTSIHLARRLGEALHHAYQGELEFHYNEGEKLLRVHWRR
jgi:NMD protein affecting ribosome stability and mRNA decay